MSALNPIIFTLKTPDQKVKESRALRLTEKHESIFEVPSYLLQRAIQTCETKTELVVYMTILRYSLGFNRSQCTVSRRFIATWTGLQYQNVGRGVEGLIAKGLVEKLPESNAKTGDAFRVLHISESELTRNQDDYTKKPESNQIENTQPVIKVITESHQLETEATSERLRSVITPITKNKKEDLKESSSNSEEIEKYISTLKEIHHQKIERKSLKQLMEKHSPSQVKLALAYVKSQGTAGGDTIKLPLCYLAKGTSMETVYNLARTREVAENSKLRLLNLGQRRREYEAEKDRQSENLLRQATSAFEDAFSNEAEQLKAISDIIQDKYKLLNPSGKTAKNLAIHYWFKNFTTSQHEVK